MTIRCKLCDKVLCGNMIRHLKCRHPNTYMQIQNLKHPAEYKKASYDGKDKKCDEMQTSSLRKYYEDAGDGLYKCKICDSIMRRNKAWHLEQNHPEVFKQYEDLMENSSRTKDDPSNPRLGWIKRFLKRLDTKRCECTVCHKVLRMPPGLLNNLKRHVRLKHPFYYEREVKAYKEAERKINKRASRKFEMVEYVMEDVDPSNLLLAADAIVTHETAEGDPEITYDETNTDLIEVPKERSQSKLRKHVNSGTSGSEQDIEEKIKQPCVENLTEARPAKGPHWKYFDSLEDKTIRCKLCDKVLCGNMIRHLKCKHWKTYMQIQKLNEFCEIDKKDFYDSKDKKSNVMHMSSMRKFFKVAGDGLTKCKICGSTIRGNKAWHLEQNHPEVLTQYQEKRENSPQTTDDPSKPQLGWIKRFLKRLDGKRCECTVCHKVLRMPPGLHNNLKRHVRIKHPFHYERELNAYKAAQNKCHIESEEFEEVEYIVEDMGFNDPLDVSEDDALNAIETYEANVSDSDIKAVETDTHSLRVGEVSKKIDQHKPTEPTLIEFLDETEPDISDIIKQLSDKNVAQTHEPNGAEFYIVDHGCYKCKECGRIIRCNDDLQMLSKHVEETHSENADRLIEPIILIDSKFVVGSED